MKDECDLHGAPRRLGWPAAGECALSGQSLLCSVHREKQWAVSVDVSERCRMWRGALRFTVKTIGSLEGFAL